MVQCIYFTVNIFFSIFLNFDTLKTKLGNHLLFINNYHAKFRNIYLFILKHWQCGIWKPMPIAVLSRASEPAKFGAS